MKNLLSVLLIFSFLFCHKIDNVSITLTQPDGTEFSCYSSGDQYYRSVHDEDGYSIIQNDTDGYYYYAIKESNKIVPSNYQVGIYNPNELSLNKNVIISREEYLNKRDRYWDNLIRRDAPSVGTINNINVFIRFADESEFPNSRTFYDTPFNAPQGPSMGHYFNEVSYDLLTVNTIHFPETDNVSINVSYQDQNPRSYYQPYNEVTNPNGYQNDNQSRIREHNLLRNSIEFIENQVPEELDIDSNNDGYVDNVTFLVRGSPGAWASLLWPHRWALYSHDVYINGSRVYDYNLNMEVGGYFTVGTLSHEFFHSLGAPDLYHYWDDTAPVAVGGWDVMDQSSDIPQSMSAYMKYRYTDWIEELPVLTYGGTYELSPISSSSNNIYRINSPASTNEYFVVEYRVREGIYEVNTPSGEDGMIIYRVNDNYTGNANGPPDELYVYRTGGTLTSNGTFSGAVFNASSGRNKFNDNTNPSCFLSDGSLGGINIANISDGEDVIRFDLVNMILLPEFTGLSFDSDEDGIANPGEEILLDLSVSNLSNLNAQDVTLFIDSNNENIEILNNEVTINNLYANNSIETSFIVNLSDDSFGLIPFTVVVNSDYVENNNVISYNDNFSFDLEVSLNQQGFPYSTLNEIHSSPIICDLDNNGQNEIIFGDHFGEIRAIDITGNETLLDFFPTDTGNQIWGSPLLGDIDLDGNDDIIFVSKSGFAYAFDLNGLKWIFDAGTQLIGTPSILNINDSYGLEIILGGFSNNQNNLLILSSSGSLINEINITDKNRSGFAIADVNNNSFDDIVFGTFDDKLYLIQDDQTIATGFPFEASDKFTVKPSIIKYPNLSEENNVLIVAPCKNKIVYGLNTSGEIQFETEFNDVASTSASVLINQSEMMIFIGFNNGDIYWFDVNGNSDFFKNINSEVIGEIIFSDLNSDLIPEIIAVNDLGEVHVLDIDGEYYQNFPINYQFPFSSAPLIYDIDEDDDLEIIAGTTNAIISIDIKENGLAEDYWSIFGNGFSRKSYIEYQFNCLLGDVNQDMQINVLDVVSLVNVIFYNEEITDSIICVADFNNDSLINVQDIILLVDYIFSNV